MVQAPYIHKNKTNYNLYSRKFITSQSKCDIFLTKIRCGAIFMDFKKCAHYGCHQHMTGVRIYRILIIYQLKLNQMYIAAHFSTHSYVSPGMQVIMSDVNLNQ